jgi:hypothetical protein
MTAKIASVPAYGIALRHSGAAARAGGAAPGACGGQDRISRLVFHPDSKRGAPVLHALDFGVRDQRVAVKDRLDQRHFEASAAQEAGPEPIDQKLHHHRDRMLARGDRPREACARRGGGIVVNIHLARTPPLRLLHPALVGVRRVVVEQIGRCGERRARLNLRDVSAHAISPFGFSSTDVIA